MKQVIVTKKMKMCQYGRLLELNEDCYFDRAFGVDICRCNHPIAVEDEITKIKIGANKK